MRHWVGWPALDRLFSRRLPDWMAGWMAGWLAGGAITWPYFIGLAKVLCRHSSRGVWGDLSCCRAQLQLQFYSSTALQLSSASWLTLSDGPG